MSGLDWDRLASFNDRFGEIGCVAARGVLQSRENSARLLVAPAVVRKVRKANAVLDVSCWTLNNGLLGASVCKALYFRSTAGQTDPQLTAL